MNHHGTPSFIITDHGTEFNKLEVREFTKLHKINIHYTTNRSSNSNSPIKRIHSNLIEHVQILYQKYKNINVKTLMQYALWGYNNSIHFVTKYKPIDFIRGHISTRHPFDINPSELIITNHLNLTKNLYKNLNR